MLTLLAIGAIILGGVSLWLQANNRLRWLSLCAEIGGIVLSVAVLFFGLFSPDLFPGSYRIAMIYYTQTWVLALALMRICAAFFTSRTVLPFGFSLSAGALPYALMKELLPHSFASALKNPNTYVEISLLLSTVSILGAYAITRRLLPIPEHNTTAYRSHILSAFARAALMQFVTLLFLIGYVYVLKQSPYWFAKLITLPLTLGMFGTYAAGKWIIGALPKPEVLDMEAEQLATVPSTPTITLPAAAPSQQTQHLGNP